MSDDPILAPIARLGAEMRAEMAQRSEMAQIRGAIMERIDRPQGALTNTREGAGLTLRAAWPAEKEARAGREDFSALLDMVIVMQGQIQRLESDIDVLKGKHS